MLNEECIPVSNIKTNVDVTINGTDALNTIAQIPEKGIAKLFHCLFGKRDADIMRKKMLIAAQTEQDINLIQSGQAELIDDRVVKKDPENFINQMINHEFQQEINNLQGNLYAALKSLAQSSEEDILDDELNPDWFARWRDTARLTSSKEFQETWGRILAEEIKSPGNMSFRSLDVLRNLSKDEAQLFEKLLPYIFGSSIVYNKIHRQEVIRVENILELQDAGLALDAEVHITLSEHNFTHNSKLYRYALEFPSFMLLMNTPISSSPLEIRVIELTKAGYEIAQSLLPPPFKEDYLRYTLNSFKNDISFLYPNQEIDLFLKDSKGILENKPYWNKPKHSKEII